MDDRTELAARFFVPIFSKILEFDPGPQIEEATMEGMATAFTLADAFLKADHESLPTTKADNDDSP